MGTALAQSQGAHSAVRADCPVQCPGAASGAEGLEQAPQAFIGLLEGRNFGKLVVKVATDASI